MTVRYLAIEGPIGVGKTTLARRLAQDLDGDLLLEGAEHNPFLSKFYQAPERYALPTQLFFLMQRAEQLAELSQTSLFGDVHIADFMLDKDRLFAELTLSEEEFRLYEQVYTHVIKDYPRPDLVIYLQAPVTTLRQRIALRGIDYELGIDEVYLRRLAESYARYFRGFDQAPVVVVDASRLDLMHNQTDYNELLIMLETVDSGHHFLPASLW